MLNPLKLLRSKKYLDRIEVGLVEIKTKPSNWRTSVQGILAAVFMLADVWGPSGNPKFTITTKALAGLFIALGLYSAADKENL